MMWLYCTGRFVDGRRDPKQFIPSSNDSKVFIEGAAVSITLHNCLQSIVVFASSAPYRIVCKHSPSLKYWRFVTSALLRLATGYLL
jgi:hypothetical protein